jgi:hypothetical protein
MTLVLKNKTMIIQLIYLLQLKFILRKKIQLKYKYGLLFHENTFL